MYKFITGRAGTGKTYSMKAYIEKYPDYGILCATTGISAINLGTTTLNSLLMYYNTDSLKDAFTEGRLERRLKLLAEVYEHIIIDEVSMMEATQLDILMLAIDNVNKKYKHDLGLVLVGDFFQLAPIEGKWAFQAESWGEFAPNTEFLTKIWRQDNIKFIEALDKARLGKGKELAERLVAEKTKFLREVDTRYNGTTIFAKNAMVDNYNSVRLLDVRSKVITSTKKEVGQTLSEWNKIPQTIELKVGDYVMILANKVNRIVSAEDEPVEGAEFSNDFIYCNGDCGTIVDYNNEVFAIKLVRNDEVVYIPRIQRYFETKYKPTIDSLA
jgi:ATP-dependent DNA helicase PIF1